jgi:5-methylcytosine-specific restriction endonuclease McrA
MGDTAERYYRIKAECIEALGGKCAGCGSIENLEFDHIDPSGKCFDIAGGSRYSKEKREAELQKCQLLCEKCHRIKTAEDTIKRRDGRPHGTKTRYNQGCRCDECREGQRLRMRKYKSSKAEVVQPVETIK